MPACRCRAPEPVALTEVPDEIGDRPVGAAGHRAGRIGTVRRRVEAVTAATNHLEEVHALRVALIGLGPLSVIDSPANTHRHGIDEFRRLTICPYRRP
jgi:hypothetical protein